jgi:hypothetical protein
MHLAKCALRRDTTVYIYVEREREGRETKEQKGLIGLFKKGIQHITILEEEE